LSSNDVTHSPVSQQPLGQKTHVSDSSQQKPLGHSSSLSQVAGQLSSSAWTSRLGPGQDSTQRPCSSHD
jgi:hypothetical protein